MRREMIIFAHKQTDNQVNKQSENSKTEAHSNPLWIVGGAGQFYTDTCHARSEMFGPVATYR